MPPDTKHIILTNTNVKLYTVQQNDYFSQSSEVTHFTAGGTHNSSLLRRSFLNFSEKLWTLVHFC